MPNGYSPTEDEKKSVFRNSTWYEIVFAFGVPDHNPQDYCHWETVNFTRMAHARLLYAFLETDPAKRNKDDALAADYGYPARPSLLSAPDRERLNKDLFHLSYGRLRHTRESKCWPDSILSELLDPVLGFMRYIAHHRQDLFESPSESKGWSDLLTLLESGRELRIRSWIGPDDQTQYQLMAGRPLPNGKPVLTSMVATPWK